MYCYFLEVLNIYTLCKSEDTSKSDKTILLKIKQASLKIEYYVS